MLKNQIDETKINSHNLTKWKNNKISFNSAKYYYFQGINPITKKYELKHGFYSCGFFESIQSEFCVKDLDNCPLIYPPIKTNNFSIDSIMDKSSDIVLKLSVVEKYQNFLIINEINLKNIENYIYFDSYILSKLLEENDINSIDHINKEDLDKINIELFFKKNNARNLFNKNISQNILDKNFYSLELDMLPDLTINCLAVFTCILAFDIFPFCDSTYIQSIDKIEFW